MFLAIREVRRAATRFGLLAAVTALLVFLVLILQAFRVALVTLFVGAIENQSAPVLVYDVDGRRSLGDSAISDELVVAVEGVDGVAAVGRIGQATIPVRAGDETTVASVIGVERADVGGPTRLVDGRAAAAPGEAVGSESAFAVGDVVEVLPGGERLEVVGTSRASELFAPTLFTPYDSFLAAVRAANPDAGEPPPNVLGVLPADGVDPAELVQAINAADPEADAFTREDAAERNPAVRIVSDLFDSLLPLFGAVVPIVSGVFFVVVTAQKAASLTLLRAIGAPARRLVAALYTQLALVLGVGVALGVGIYGALTTVEVAGVDLPFQTGAVLLWSALVAALCAAAAGFAARRVLRLDPITATTGAGVGR